MKALRMTRLETDRPARFPGHGMARALVLVSGFCALFGLSGCGQVSRDSGEGDSLPTDSLATERPQLDSLPAPRAGWIEYSARDRKLTFYQLHASGRWMVKRSDRDKAYPVGAEHTLPEGLNPAETFVYYTRPGGQVSRGITLAQIQNASREHVSIAR